MNGQPHGAPNGQPHGGSHGPSVWTVSAKTRQGTTPHRTTPDLSFRGETLHHVVTWVTREARRGRLDAFSLGWLRDDMDAATRRRFA